MKKILICIIFLFISNCATSPYTSKEAQKNLIKENIIKEGMLLTQLREFLGYSQYGWSIPFKETFSQEYQVLSSNNDYMNEPAYLFKSNKKGKDIFGTYYSDTRLIKIFDNSLDLYDYLLTFEDLNYKDKAKLIKTKTFLDRKKKEDKEKERLAKKDSSNKTNKKIKKTGASGSSFLISQKGHIITNYHVIENCNTIPKVKYKDSEVDAKIISKDKFLDLALLKSELKNQNYLEISEKLPKRLQRVIAAGFPFGEKISDDIKFTSGIISSLKGYGDDSTRLQIDAALNPGNSGGPIVDEKSGKLVAVAVAGLRKDKTESVNFGIKASSLKNFLNSNEINLKSNKLKNINDISDLLESSTLYVYCY